MTNILFYGIALIVAAPHCEHTTHILQCTAAHAHFTHTQTQCIYHAPPKHAFECICIISFISSSLPISLSAAAHTTHPKSIVMLLFWWFSISAVQRSRQLFAWLAYICICTETAYASHSSIPNSTQSVAQTCELRARVSHYQR